MLLRHLKISWSTESSLALLPHLPHSYLHLSLYPFSQIKVSIQMTAPVRSPGALYPTSLTPHLPIDSCLPPLNRCLWDTWDVPGFMPGPGLTGKWGQCGFCPQRTCNPVIMWKSPHFVKETRYCEEKKGYWGNWFCPLVPSTAPQLSLSCHYHQWPSSKGSSPLYGSSSTLLLELSFWKK